tara:strand:+ start:3246 stop:3953 length:708 start_codon:yes stop_codon:yes gene_type:complete
LGKENSLKLIRMKKYCKVKTRVANLYKTSSFKSELVTQAIQNEILEIQDEDKNWYKVRQWDNYESWIHSFYVTEMNVTETFNYFHPYSLNIENVKFINKRFKSKKFFSDNNLINTAKEFLGIPYLWGGKSYIGFDCSGFVQTVFFDFGIDLPRDSYQQINYEGLVEIKYSEVQAGDLLFFLDNKHVNHVAISIGNEEIIHSSGYVKIEKLKENKELYQKLYKVMSIRSLNELVYE